MRTPLLYMRKKGLFGSFFGKHCSIPGLSKSVGGAIELGINPGFPVGPELITNGDASQGLTGWTAYGTDAPGCLVYDSSIGDSGVFQISNITAGSNGFGQLVAFEAGKSYFIRVALYVDKSLEINIMVGTGVSGSQTGSFNVKSSGYFDTKITVDATATAISFQLPVNVSISALVDDISVREIL